MYSLLLERERREGVKVDILLCCGDFQVSAVREGRGSHEVRPMTVVHWKRCKT